MFPHLNLSNFSIQRRIICDLSPALPSRDPIPPTIFRQYAYVRISHALRTALQIRKAIFTFLSSLIGNHQVGVCQHYQVLWIFQHTSFEGSKHSLHIPSQPNNEKNRLCISRQSYLFLYLPKRRRMTECVRARMISVGF